MKRTTARTDYRVTIENIDIALAQCAHLIETMPDGEKLWPIFDRLERERELLTCKQDRLAAAKARVRELSAHQTEARS